MVPTLMKVYAKPIINEYTHSTNTVDIVHRAMLGLDLRFIDSNANQKKNTSKVVYTHTHTHAHTE